MGGCCSDAADGPAARDSRRASNASPHHGGGGGSNHSTPLLPRQPNANPAINVFERVFKLSDAIGNGGSSVCYKCIERSTGQVYAVKVLNKRKLYQQSADLVQQILREVELLRSVNHPNIIRLYNVYEDQEAIYVVTEYVGGGELFDFVIRRGRLTESEAASVIRQVLCALCYLHSKGIVHRDLKPENLLLTSASTTAEIKLIDFGSSTRVTLGGAHTILGTLGYVAPEVLKGKYYSTPVDMWALGVIGFVLLCGCFPFDQSDASAMKRAQYKLRWPDWATSLSMASREFIGSLLVYDPAKRATASQALSHPWISGNAAPAVALASPGRLSSLTRSSARAGSRLGSSIGRSPAEPAPLHAVYGSV